MGVVGQSSVWLGSDHLLSATSVGYTEQYRRYYLRDIAALVVQRNRRWMVMSLVFGAIVVFVGLLGAVLAMDNDSATQAVGIFFLVVFVLPALVALVVNLVRGPTCQVRVQTAVQSAPLQAVGRVRAAEKLLARLEPLIRAAQSEPQPTPSAAAAETPAPAPLDPPA